MTTAKKTPVKRATKEVAPVEPASPMALIEMAVNKDMDVEKLAALMELQTKWEKKQAEKAFDAALSKFQFECPAIQKTRSASFGTTRNGATGASYKYASFEDVQKQIRVPLFENGLSYSFDQSVNDTGLMRLRCTLKHVDGHSRTSDFILPADNSGGKNVIQAAASSNTYMMRYTLLNVLGIGTADEDDDCHSVQRQPTQSDTLNKTMTEDVEDIELARTAMLNATTMSELQTAAEFMKKLPNSHAKDDMRKFYSQRRKEIANGVSQ